MESHKETDDIIQKFTDSCKNHDRLSIADIKKEILGFSNYLNRAYTLINSTGDMSQSHILLRNSNIFKYRVMGFVESEIIKNIK